MLTSTYLHIRMLLWCVFFIFCRSRFFLRNFFDGAWRQLRLFSDLWILMLSWWFFFFLCRYWFTIIGFMLVSSKLFRNVWKCVSFCLRWILFTAGHENNIRLPVFITVKLCMWIDTIDTWYWIKASTIKTMVLPPLPLITTTTLITRALRERKPPPTPKFEPKVIRDVNPDFRINLDPDVCRICPKMLWMCYHVGLSHFARYGTNRPLIVCEMLTNVQKSPIQQWWRKWKSDPESTRGSGSPPKVNHF